MKRDDCNRYFYPAVVKLVGNGGDWSVETVEKLEQLLGFPIYKIYIGQADDMDKPMTEDVKRKLTLLAGPYSEVFVRILEKRQNDT
jgi:hypothetical protein